MVPLGSASLYLHLNRLYLRQTHDVTNLISWSFLYRCQLFHFSGKGARIHLCFPVFYSISSFLSFCGVFCILSMTSIDFRFKFMIYLLACITLGGYRRDRRYLG